MDLRDINFGHLAAAINGVTNVETLAVTSNPVIPPFTNHHVMIQGAVQVTNGAGAGTVTLKLYRGTTITGTLVATSDAVAIGAAAKFSFAFNAQEDLANFAGVQYTLSVTFSVNQAGNNIDFADLIVFLL